jgi:hypothetical protein
MLDSFLQPPVTSSFKGPTYSSQCLVPSQPQFFPKYEELKFHTSIKQVKLYLSEGKTKDSELSGIKHSLNLFAHNYFIKAILFLGVIPRYLIITPLLKDSLSVCIFQICSVLWQHVYGVSVCLLLR